MLMTTKAPAAPMPSAAREPAMILRTPVRVGTGVQATPSAEVCGACWSVGVMGDPPGWCRCVAAMGQPSRQTPGPVAIRSVGSAGESCVPRSVDAAAPSSVGRTLAGPYPRWVQSSDKKVTVVVADDHPFFRDGVTRGLLTSGMTTVV